MNFEEILNATSLESARRRSNSSLKSLRHMVRDLPPTLGFARRISAHPFSVIAEIKTKSPSMGRMSLVADKTADIAHKIYDRHPIVSAISVLTQESHFGGSEARLRMVRRQSRKPILRKDFIRDEYEVYFSRVIGADAILLMANVVTDKKLFLHLHDLATSLGLDVLCEIHSEEELEVIPPSAKIYGINSRKFKDSRAFFVSKLTRHVSKDATTDLAVFELIHKLPANVLKIAESGMTSNNIGGILKKYPFDAALIGTSLLKGDEKHAEQELNLIESAIAAASSEMASKANQPGSVLAHA
jgi:indole-3-glycerol phosphate synthase